MIPAVPPPPFTRRRWLVTWLRTAAIGLGLLVLVFVPYEIAERLWLRERYTLDELFVFHILRGVGASILVGTWTLLHTLRTYRRYDRDFNAAYLSLKQTMESRTQDLVRARAFTERLFDALQDRLIVIDRQGRVVKANRVAIEAYGADPIGRDCSMLGDACRPGCDGCVAKQALAAGRPVHTICTDARTGRVFSVHAYPVPDPEGRDDLVIESAVDVTEARRLEAQVRGQEKMAALGVLAAGVAHDLGNPLASMSSELEMLQAEDDLDRVKRSVSVLRGQVARMARTLREMTAFARRRGEDVSDVEVAAAVRDALRMVRHDPRARRVQVETLLQPALPRLRMVEDHLVMVLVNLIINAFDAMPDGGTLTLRGELVGGGVELHVSDTGVGMSEEVRRRATEPLFTTKSGGRGTGLGLSVSVDIMRSLGGGLEIASRPGEGTTVTLHFPPSVLVWEEARRASGLEAGARRPWSDDDARRALANEVAHA